MILLDTNVILWATLQPEKLTRPAAAAINDSRNTIFVSAASAWEIATKVRLGKLDLARVLEDDFSNWMHKAGYIQLDLEVETALRTGRLPGPHKDPFDRMIAAQALRLDIPIVSSDAALDGFGIRRIW